LVAIPAGLYSLYRIKQEAPGSFLFKQARVGKEKNHFNCIKFRSMYENSKFDPYTREKDNRIFPWGNIMRKTRIDELPQLLNVLKGEMHLIGPRAEWNILVENYEKEIPYYNERHIVSPGITGWAQVKYPYGANSEDAKQKLMYDLYYIKYWSMKLEIKTIIKTIKVVLGQKGI
jgi:lipopolysaccharide/colanic/teichoic acid biosynthesis glycosyltransferase